MARKQRGLFGNIGRGFTPSESIADEAEALTLQRVDEAGAVVRPAAIDNFYVEDEFQRRSEEQPLLFDAEGEAAARAAVVEAAGSQQEAADATVFADGHREIVEASRERMMLAQRVLRSFARRAKGDKVMYYLRLLGLLGGDIAGVAGAAIFLGEVVSLAIMQAVASGTAAVTAGVVGGEVKDLSRAIRRRKPVEKLSEDERQFAHLFAGPSGEALLKLVVALAFTVAALIACAVFALRMATEGAVAGLTFGCLAAAISLASFLAVYAYSDEVADLIDNSAADYRRELAFAQKLSAHPARRRYAEATAEAASIRGEYTLRGQAAAKSMLALVAHVLHNNPGVAGHGWASRQPPDHAEPESHAVLHSVSLEPSAGSISGNRDRGVQ